ncbi:DDE-type integrase/transposase/recombinase [Nocardioides rotundus]|uniref:DDE-type integrase/transposase/recombinase n=1 Tax=Nocardioides rotundus TaxID=1774216 RepID=UPI001CBF1568|nr:DDE-type integrase/transposase/recombinase [Nocardioides rotundus]UAL30385.1 DDE-type integrase/transposase/recombinase [Nocardioides rotundus]
MTYQLYLALDVFSRMVTGWRVETREDDDLAAEMFENAFTVRGVLPRIIHSDGGPSMTSRTLGDLFAELGIEVSRNRPRVSNDNPYSEALFKTAKYTPDYPAFFNDLDHARSWASDFVEGYNHRHHHGGLEGHTPHDVHHGTWTGVHHRRQNTMDALYAAHPERFASPPRVRTPMAQVAINQKTNRDRLHAG